MKKNDFSTVGDVLKRFEQKEDKYISREFQQYGYDLARELDDLKRVGLYIKLAKDTPRGRLEAARSFVKDANRVKSRARLFMWKVGQLNKEAKEKKKK